MEKYITKAIGFQAIIYSPILVLAIVILVYTAINDKNIIEAIRTSATMLFGGVALLGFIMVIMDLMGLIGLLYCNPE